MKIQALAGVSGKINHIDQSSPKIKSRFCEKSYQVFHDYSCQNP